MADVFTGHFVLLKAPSYTYILKLTDRAKIKPLAWNGFLQSSLGLEARPSVWCTEAFPDTRS